MLVDCVHGMYISSDLGDSDRTWHPALGLDESTSSILPDINILISITNLQVKINNTFLLTLPSSSSRLNLRASPC